jgi:hypothetical protein
MRLKRKIPTFIFGVSIGLVIGVAFFVFKLNDLFDRLRVAATEKVTVIEQPVKIVHPEEETVKKDRERFKIRLGKKAKVNYKEVDSILAEDSRINIATDELLSIKNVKVIRIGDNIAGHDTLAAKLANVEDKKNSTSDLYFIEFWKTPLNSKGYRFTKNKIMLYGFMDVNNVLLYQLDNSFYLKSSDQVYKLFYGSEFKKLERVLDSELLARIN